MKMQTDQTIQKEVMDELKWDSAIKSSDIGVAVNEGIVTLSGFVDNFTKKRKAEEAALRIKGVKGVAENIVVRFGSSYQKTDTDIAKAVVNALKWKTAVHEDKVKIKVENGWVSLEGTVDWQFEKEAVKKAVEPLLGVRGISNLLTVAPKIKLDASNIKEKIKAAFYRSASIDAKNILVESDASTVTLSGTVRSNAEKKDAEAAAWNAPGVISVKNNLKIEVPVFSN